MTKLLVTAFLLLQLLYEVLAEVPCGGEYPSGYVKYAGDNNILKLHLETLSWPAAREVCRSEGADLAVATTPEKIDYIRDSEEPGWVWIGIHRPKGEGGDWVRVDTGQPIPYSSPWDDVTNRDDFNCGLSHTSGKISDHNCRFELPFACEISLAKGCPEVPGEEGSTGDAAALGSRGLMRLTGYVVVELLYIVYYAVANI